MTVKNLAENTQEIFPNAGIPAILKRIDQAQKVICDGKVLEQRYLLSDPSTNFAWDLPTKFLSLKPNGLKLYDSDGNPLYLGNYGYDYKIIFGKFYIYSLTSTPITGLDSGIDSVYMEVYEKPGTITATSDSFDLPEEYHNAIEAQVKKLMFADFEVEQIINSQVVKSRDWNAVRFWESQFKYFKKEAKKALVKQTPAGEAIYYPYSGGIELPEVPLDSSASSVTLTGFSISKIVDVTFTESGSAYTENSKSGFGTLTYSYSDANTIVITSSGEFTTSIHADPSNVGEFNWTRDSSSQITITYLSGWTVSNVIIYIP